METENKHEVLRILPFRLDEQLYGLHLRHVQRVIRAVAITPLPQAPEIIRGVVTVHGRVIPVVDIRKRFELPERMLQARDPMILAETARRPVVIPVDSIRGVVEIEKEAVTEADQAAPGVTHVREIAAVSDGMLFIHDLDRFLSLDEERKLDQSMMDFQGDK